MKKLLFLVILTFYLGISSKVKAQLTGIAINDDGTKADTSAILDVNVNVTSPKRGFLLPRMTTAQRDAIYQPAKGLMIYVTNVDSLEINLGTPASPIWGNLMTSSSYTGWYTTGNSGTNSVTNFLGTTDNNSLSIRTNSIERMLIDNFGHVGIGSSAFDATNPERLLVDYGTTTSNTIANFYGNIDNYLQINIKNSSSGTSASSDFVATADNGTDSTYYVDLGINSSNYSSTIYNWGGANDAYLYSYSRNLLIGSERQATDLIFLLGGGVVKTNTVLRMIGSSGNIVIGKGEATAAPVGNTLRGPNSSGGNISGGSLTIQGGKATGTGTGGNINIYGGSTVSGSIGTVNINDNFNSATNINTGTSTSDVTIGGSSNNILFPKFTTVGSLIYTAVNTGQIGSIIPGTSGYILQSNGSGFAPTWVNPTSLVAANAWTLVGNSGTTAGTNFIGTTDAVDFVTKTNNTERMRVLSSGNIGIGTNAPVTTLQVNGITGFGRASTTNGQTTFYNATNANTVGIISGITGTSYTLTLPTAAASVNGQMLTSTTGGVLSWTSPSSVDWSLLGNSGTNAATNFIGTSDAIDFVARTNNTERMRILSTGNIGIGTTTAATTLQINGTTGFGKASTTNGQTTFYNSTNANTVGIISGVTGASYTLTLPTAVASANGQVLSSTTGGVLSWSNISSSAWSLLGNSGTNAATNFIGTSDAIDFVTRTNNTERMRILSTGEMGIGTTAPATTLQINGTTGFGKASTTTGQVNFYNSTNANTVNIVSGITSAGYTLTLPTAVATVNGQVLTSTTGGVLSWTNPSAASAWQLLGNSGTNAATNFVGTTDAVDFVTRTNNTERMRITSAGLVGVGTASPTAGSSLDVKGHLALSNGGTASELRFYEPSGSGTNYTAFKAQAQAADVTYTLPAADGSNGQLLTTNGSGTLSWSTAGSSTSYGITPVINDQSGALGGSYTFLTEVAVSVVAGDILNTNAYFSGLFGLTFSGIRVTRSTISGSGSVGTVVGYCFTHAGGGSKYQATNVTGRESGVAVGTWYYKLWVMSAYSAGSENYNMVITKTK